MVCGELCTRGYRRSEHTYRFEFTVKFATITGAFIYRNMHNGTINFTLKNHSFNGKTAGLCVFNVLLALCQFWDEHKNKHLLISVPVNQDKHPPNFLELLLFVELRKCRFFLSVAAPMTSSNNRFHHLEVRVNLTMRTIIVTMGIQRPLEK